MIYIKLPYIPGSARPTFKKITECPTSPGNGPEFTAEKIGGGRIELNSINCNPLHKMRVVLYGEIKPIGYDD